MLSFLSCLALSLSPSSPVSCLAVSLSCLAHVLMCSSLSLVLNSLSCLALCHASRSVVLGSVSCLALSHTLLSVSCIALSLMLGSHSHGVGIGAAEPAHVVCTCWLCAASVAGGIVQGRTISQRVTSHTAACSWSSHQQALTVTHSGR